MIHTVLIMMARMMHLCLFCLEYTSQMIHKKHCSCSLLSHVENQTMKTRDMRFNEKTSQTFIQMRYSSISVSLEDKSWLTNGDHHH